MTIKGLRFILGGNFVLQLNEQNQPQISTNISRNGQHLHDYRVNKW